MRLILIRHGATDCSRARRYCGCSDPPLNDEGIRQARHLAVRLKGTRIDRVYSSDLERARQTAEIVFPKHAIELAADWREMNFGLFEGLTHEQIMDRYPTLYQAWISNPIEVKIPEGEGLCDLNKRVQESISAAVSQHEGGTVAVVTHGGPIRVALCDALRLGPALFWQVEQALGAWNAIDYAEGMLPVVAVMNDVSHLAVPEAQVR
jgi:alpha-ribazole phosphatase